MTDQDDSSEHDLLACSRTIRTRLGTCSSRGCGGAAGTTAASSRHRRSRRRPRNRTGAAPAATRASTSAPPSQTATVDKPRHLSHQHLSHPRHPPPVPPTRAPIFRSERAARRRKGEGLSVHYTGWLYDPTQPEMKGRMFDSSKERGPFDFELGAGQVIPGWDQGFDGMKIGGRRRLIIPPSLGYGVDGAGGGIIPPNATLIFEMELLDVQQ